MTAPTSRSTSLPMRLGRVGAVLVALSVFGCYVYDAQERADARMQRTQDAAPPTGGGADATGTAGGGKAGEMPAALPSSKVLVIEPSNLLSSSKFIAIPPAQVEMLPSTKGLVIDSQPFLSGSKSGVIVMDPAGEAGQAPGFKKPPALLPSSKVLVPHEQKFLFSSKFAAPAEGPVLDLMKQAAESMKAKAETEQSPQSGPQSKSPQK